MTHMKSACTSALSSPKQTPSAPVTGFVVGGKSVVCVQVILNGRSLLLFWPFTVTLRIKPGGQAVWESELNRDCKTESGGRC